MTGTGSGITALYPVSLCRCPEAEKADFARPENPGPARAGGAAHPLCADAVLPPRPSGLDPDALAPLHGRTGVAAMDRPRGDVARPAAFGDRRGGRPFLQASRH